MVEEIEMITEVPPVEFKEDIYLDEELGRMAKARDEKVRNALNNLKCKLSIMEQQYNTANGIVMASDCLKQAGVLYPKIMDSVDVARHAKGIINSMMNRLDTIIDGNKPHIPLASFSDNVKNSLMLFCAEFYDRCTLTSLIMIDEGEYYDEDEDAAKLDVSKQLTMYVAKQLVVLKICQLVGPATDDIANFIISANEEIEKVREERDKANKENEGEDNE